MVFISKILPNPIGRDSLGEVIVIRNGGNVDVDIGGWKIIDKSKKTFVFPSGYVISGGNSVSIDYNQSKIILNNNGDEINLFDNSGKLIDKINFNSSKEGYFIKHNGNFEKTIFVKNNNVIDYKRQDNFSSKRNIQDINKNEARLVSINIINPNNFNIYFMALVVASLLAVLFWMFFKNIKK